MYLARFDSDAMTLTLGTTGAWGQFIPTWQFPEGVPTEEFCTSVLVSLGYHPLPWTEREHAAFGTFMELAELELPPRHAPSTAQRELEESLADLPPRFVPAAL